MILFLLGSYSTCFFVPFVLSSQGKPPMYSIRRGNPTIAIIIDSVAIIILLCYLVYYLSVIQSTPVN